MTKLEMETRDERDMWELDFEDDKDDGLKDGKIVADRQTDSEPMYRTTKNKNNKHKNKNKDKNKREEKENEML